jgi:hypothetical protein
MALYHPIDVIKVYQTGGFAPCYEELAIPIPEQFFRYFSVG